MTKSVLRILLVEDQEDDAFLLKQAFAKSGVPPRLLVVENGLEAVKYLNGDGHFADRDKFPVPDLLLLDLNMPRMNGFEVLQWLRTESSHKTLFAHIFSASSRESDVQRAYELGANGYVVKPTRMDDLVAFASSLRDWHHFVSFSSKESVPLNTSS